ncbi:MAG TPA: hypothetical protein VF588_10565 [Pyrinomonadaceae bacterium]|jgi:hypothetical protein
MMDAEFEYEDGAAARSLADSLCGEWERLCADYLPLASEGSIWRYSRPPGPGDAEQGWKLHVSATILTANEVLKRIAAPLSERGAQFKGPSSLRELQRLNSGLLYGYSQVGKFITVYPRTAEEAISLARLLHGLTRGLPAPSVPFERRFRPGSSVFYRYGSFKRIDLDNEDGTRMHAVRDPEGRLVADVRESVSAPAWVSDPFAGRAAVRRRAVSPGGPLATTYRALQALTQRGKGGVYKALDLRASTPRVCILKEGRARGETAWDGRDGRWRVRHEKGALCALRAAGVDAPRVYSSFEEGGNYYLVTEYVEGESFQALLNRRRRRLSLSQVFAYGERLSRMLSGIHAAGWAWRDFKPANVIITEGGDLRPLDFEGACPVERPDPSPWGTPGFTPPHAGDTPQAGVCGDLYALGAFIYFLLTGRLPQSPAAAPVSGLRRGVPARVLRVVNRLLNPDPRERPDAQTVAEELGAFRRTARASSNHGGRALLRAGLRRRRAFRREVDASRERGEPGV